MAGGQPKSELTEKRIVNALLLYGLEDMLHLRWIAKTVHKLTGIPLELLVLHPHLEAIHLLKAVYAVVGDAVMHEGGFDPPSSYDGKEEVELPDGTRVDRREDSKRGAGLRHQRLGQEDIKIHAE